MALVEHEVDSEYDSALVSFVYALSIHLDGGWEGFIEFTLKLSAIITIARLLTIKKAV